METLKKVSSWSGVSVTVNCCTQIWHGSIGFDYTSLKGDILEEYKYYICMIKVVRTNLLHKCNIFIIYYIIHVVLEVQKENTAIMQKINTQKLQMEKLCRPT